MSVTLSALEVKISVGATTVGSEVSLRSPTFCFSVNHTLTLRGTSLVTVTMPSFTSLSKYILRVFSFCVLFTGVSADGLNPQSHPAAGEIIEVGKPYTIVWTPGTTGNVSIVLKANSDWTAQTIICRSALNSLNILSFDRNADYTCSSLDRKFRVLHLDTQSFSCLR